MEERFMAEALALARRGLGMVSPNPMVGAVLVKQGRIVGRGFHRRFGGPHAEVIAIQDAKGQAAGSTLFVTMEPCCFLGKTPACTDAIIRAGIRRVVTATRDPNPRVNGQGIRCLRRAGIAVQVGMLAGAARRLNEAYFTFVTEHRPFVLLKVAATLDGMMATSTGESQWITGPAARHQGQQLRQAADAVVVGVNSVLKDDPRLTCRLRKRKRLVRVVLDCFLRLGPESRLFREPGPVVVFTTSNREGKIRRLEKAGAEIVRVRMESKDRLSWQDILAELYRRQVVTVLIEGGATVVSSALEAGIVDKAFFFQAPKVLGPGKLFSQGMKPRTLTGALVLKDVQHTQLGPDWLTAGYVYRFG